MHDIITFPMWENMFPMREHFLERNEMFFTLQVQSRKRNVIIDQIRYKNYHSAASSWQTEGKRSTHDTHSISRSRHSFSLFGYRWWCTPANVNIILSWAKILLKSAQLGRENPFYYIICCNLILLFETYSQQWTFSFYRISRFQIAYRVPIEDF